MAADNGGRRLQTTADGYGQQRTERGGLTAEGGGGMDGSKWQRQNKNECGAVVTNPFFSQNLPVASFFLPMDLPVAPAKTNHQQTKSGQICPPAKKKDSNTTSLVTIETDRSQQVHHLPEVI